jgi:hypothetical protein
MSLDSQMYQLLQGFVDGRAYPDIAKDGASTPYITYQFVGGQPVNFLKQEVPDKSNTRVQVNVWSATRVEARAIAKQVEDAMRMSAMQVTVLGQPVSVYEEDTKLRGSIQDFSVWN